MSFYFGMRISVTLFSPFTQKLREDQVNPIIYPFSFENRQMFSLSIVFMLFLTAQLEIV